MDIRLHYVERGEGFPLVLLHGNGEDSGYFAAQLGPFSRAYRVLAVDTRGHGASPRGGAPFTLSQFADDLRGFLDGLGIGRAHILGFSDGGNIALLFALRYPERVEKLVLNGANLSPAGVKRRYQVPIELAHGLLRVLSRFDKRAVPRRELLGLMATQPDIDPAALAAIRAPTLVIAGTRDMIREAHTRDIAAAIPGARLVLAEGDHFLAAKRPAAFNAAVLGFLAGRG